MAAFSWRRVWLSIKDLAVVAEDWRKGVSRLVALLAFLGLTGGAVLAPGAVLPPAWWARLLLVALFVCMLTIGVQAVYRHRAALDDLRARSVSLHASQRDRIEHVKQLAGRIQRSLSRLDFDDYPKAHAWIAELDDDVAALAEWSGPPATAFVEVMRTNLKAIELATDRANAIRGARESILSWRQMFVTYWNGVLALRPLIPPEDR